MKILSAVFSSMALLLMPKCPLCLAAYLTLLTGLSISASAARHLHTAVIIVFASMLTLVMLSTLVRRWRRRI